MRCETPGCWNLAQDRHHIKHRGSGGKDVPENMIRLCRPCHVAVHTLGWRTFSDKYGLTERFEKARLPFN